MKKMVAIPALFRITLRRLRCYTLQPRAGQRAHGTKAEPSIRTGQKVPRSEIVARIPFWKRLGSLTRAAETYGQFQRQRPLRTQLCTSLVIFGCGDVAAQTLSGKDYSLERTGRALVIGAVSSIPSYKWFLFVSQNFNYASRIGSIATKVVIQQIVFAPIINTYFFGMQALLAGESAGQIWERIRRTVPTSLVNSVKIWPAWRG